MTRELEQGQVYDITLRNGEELAGYTLYEMGEGTITVGYDGHDDDPTLPPEAVGLRRIVRMSDVKDINPIG